MATGIFVFARDIFLGTIKPVAAEGFRLLPDALLYGTGALSLITYQTPMLFLFAVVVSSFISSNLIARMMMTFMPQDVPPAKASESCMPGLWSPSATRLSLLSELANPSGFPSMPMFVLSTVITYCLSGVIQLSDVLNELGPDYKAKIPTTVALSAFLLIVFSLYLLINECNGFLTILASIALGAVVGGLLSVIFPLIFGQESINILGLPLFLKRDQVGKPLYICAAKQ
jgi:hypothetical protein